MSSAFDLIEGDVGTVIDITVSRGFGEHGGGDGQASLLDPNADWAADELVGLTVKNITDGSEGTITANTENTVTAILAGGTNNYWEDGDDYVIPMNILGGTLTWYWQHGTNEPTSKSGTIQDGPNGITRYTTIANDIEAEDLRVQVEANLPSGWVGRSDPVHFKVGRKLIRGL